MQAFVLCAFFAYMAANAIQGSQREYSVDGAMYSVAPEYAGQGREESLRLNAEMGHRLSDRQQLGVRLGYDWVDYRPGRGSVCAVYSLHLNPLSRNVLFCSVSPGLAFGGLPASGAGFDDLDDTKVQLGLGAGLKAFTSERAAVRLEYRYERVLDTPRRLSGGGCIVGYANEDFDQHGVYVGLSVLVGRRDAAGP